MVREDSALTISWVLLTTGDRPELREAISSVLADPSVQAVIVVNNRSDPVDVGEDDRVVSLCPGRNLGVPGGRDLGLRHSTTDLVGFLDDDARLETGVDSAAIRSLFTDESVGALSLRIVDESGATARRHVPRAGSGSAARSGAVVSFLGGASVVRRSAYEDAGGYWAELFYAHEELDLAWRMADRAWKVSYAADLVVVHPRTPVSRHPEGWYRTGRNRVMIARRNLPLLVLITHVVVWLVLGFFRAGAARSAYLRGWLEGWRQPVERQPMTWRTVWRLSRLGRPPFL